MKPPKIVWHNGKCDACNKPFVLVCHFGYDTSPERDYRICMQCMKDNLDMILYGWNDYNGR